MLPDGGAVTVTLDGRPHTKVLSGCRFVPLVGEFGREDERHGATLVARDQLPQLRAALIVE